MPKNNESNVILKYQLLTAKLLWSGDAGLFRTGVSPIGSMPVRSVSGWSSMSRNSRSEDSSDNCRSAGAGVDVECAIGDGKSES